MELVELGGRGHQDAEEGVAFAGRPHAEVLDAGDGHRHAPSQIEDLQEADRIEEQLKM